MSAPSARGEPTVTYLELRSSTPDGDAAGGLRHDMAGLVLLHVQEIAADGEPRGAVTFLHDAGEHGGRGLALARALAERGWAVALPDLRGHGRSEGPRGHSNGVKEVLRDLADVQDHLAYRQPEAPKVLVGHGLGAIWAAAYALEKPGEIAALVLVAPLWEPKFELPKAAGGVMKLFKKVGPDAPGKLGWSTPSDDALVHDVITLRAGEQAIETAAKVRARCGELSLPMLVLHGDGDALSPASAAPRASQLEVVTIAGAPHDLLNDRGAPETLARIADWLDRAVPRG